MVYTSAGHLFNAPTSRGDYELQAVTEVAAAAAAG
jgi:hypothetical protein